jgi:myosin heavy subunit
MRRLNPTQALRARDSIINALYDRAFRWVVDKLNQMLKSSYDKSKDGNVPFIGLLDIPGFSEESGSFYGFCHNLMNEKLQQVYNSEIIGKKLEMLVEQVNSDVSSPIGFFNFRKAIAYSLSGKPMIDLMSSILRTLDDQAWPKKLNDESFRKALSLLLPDDSGVRDSFFFKSRKSA